jgi:hypothetical protein
MWTGDDRDVSPVLGAPALVCRRHIDHGIVTSTSCPA